MFDLRAALPASVPNPSATLSPTLLSSPLQLQGKIPILVPDRIDQRPHLSNDAHDPFE